MPVKRDVRLFAVSQGGIHFRHCVLRNTQVYLGIRRVLHHEWNVLIGQWNYSHGLMGSSGCFIILTSPARFTFSSGVSKIQPHDPPHPKATETKLQNAAQTPLHRDRCDTSMDHSHLHQCFQSAQANEGNEHLHHRRLLHYPSTIIPTVAVSPHRACSDQT